MMTQFLAFKKLSSLLKIRYIQTTTVNWNMFTATLGNTKYIIKHYNIFTKKKGKQYV